MHEILQKFKKSRKLVIGIALGVILILIISLVILSTYSIHKSAKPSAEKLGVKKLPQDIKKTISLQPVASVAASFKLPILMYHYVEYVKDKNDKERQLLNVNPDIFEKQIQTLIAAHFTFITAKELGDIVTGTTKLPQKPIMLTFDDGHWDLDTDVLPILKKYHVPVTAYIVPGFVGKNTDSLTPSELQDVVNSGLVDIGAHTVHHVALKGKPFKTVQYEVNESKTMLEEQYHAHVYAFAYPYGSFDQQAIDVVKQAGFTTAASTIAGNIQGNQNRFFLFRVRPGGMIGQTLLNYLNVTWHADSMFKE